MDQMPLANASTKLTASGSAPTAATFTAMCRASRIAAPAITGIASRKLNSAAAAGPRPPHRAAHDRPEPWPVYDQHRTQRRHVQRHLDEDARRVHTGDDLEHPQVPRAGHRQEFREPLHQPQHDPLPERHATRPATSATIPKSIAPLRRRLFRCVRPVNNRLATASTTSWANRAMRKYEPW